MRVLLLSTPIAGAWMRNGSTRAVVELSRALSGQGIRPLVLVGRGGEVPQGCEAVPVTRFGVVPAVLGARPELIHAVFAPRPATSLALAAIARATRAAVVQTVASVPLRFGGVRHLLVGDAIVATSKSTETILLSRGVVRERLHLVPMPFGHPGEVEPTREAKRHTILFGGDYEFGDSLPSTLRAFGEMSSPHGVVPELVIAARDKTRRGASVATALRAQLARSSTLRDRVRVIGEVPTLLPWIAAARCVVLPASSTYAKLDHPRVLLEAIALGTRIVVGTAPSLAELVLHPSLGEVVRDVSSLREAMERSFELPPPEKEAIVRVLDARRPEVVAGAYASLYRAVVTKRR